MIEAMVAMIGFWPVVIGVIIAFLLGKKGGLSAKLGILFGALVFLISCLGALHGANVVDGWVLTVISMVVGAYAVIFIGVILLANAYFSGVLAKMLLPRQPHRDK